MGPFALLLFALLCACGRREEEPSRSSFSEGTTPGVDASSTSRPAAHLRVYIDASESELTDPGARVLLHWQTLGRGGAEGPAEEESLTARVGEPFEFDVPAGSRIGLSASLGEGRAERSLWPLEPGGSERVEMALALPTGLVRGRLLTPEGRPAADRLLAVGPRETRTAPDGSFELRLPITRDPLVLHAVGAPPLLVERPQGDGDLGELRLPRGGCLRLIQSGGGAGSSLVRLIDPVTHSTWERQVPPGEEQELLFEALPASTRLSLRVFREEPGLGKGRWQLAWQAREGVRVRPGETLPLTLELPGRGPIEGRLIDLEGRPLGGVELTCFAIEPGERVQATYVAAGRPHLGVVRTQADGRFRFEGVPGGIWLVGPTRGGWNATAPGGRGLAYAALPVTTGAGECELALARGLALEGRVEGASSGSIEARSEAFGGSREARIHQDGSFRIERLMPGPHELHAAGEVLLRGIDPATTHLDLTLRASDSSAGGR